MQYTRDSTMKQPEHPSRAKKRSFETMILAGTKPQTADCTVKRCKSLSAEVINVFYDHPVVYASEFKEELEKSCSRFQNDVTMHYKGMDDNARMLRKRVLSDYSAILYCLDNLGLVCAREAVNVCIENICSIQEESHDSSGLNGEFRFLLRKFLQEILGIISKFLFPDVGGDYSKLVSMGYISPKLNQFLQICHSFVTDKDVVCLVFVQRVIAAKVLERFMKNETFGLDVNFMFVTKIVEKGVDLLKSVIFFDLPKTLRGFVRSGENCSRFIIMLEQGNVKQRDEVFDLVSKTDIALNPGSRTCLSKNSTDAYSVDSTGACVSGDSSVSLIYRYCLILPGDLYYTPKPVFEFSSSEGLVSCKMKLPPNAPFESITGPCSKNSLLAKRLVCLEACKKLHHMRALNDKLLPSSEENKESSPSLEHDVESGAGTTKRKELHGSVPIHALYGNWDENSTGVTFRSYRIDFKYEDTHLYAGFFLLLESALDEDVGKFELDLHLSSNRLVKTFISPYVDVHLTPEKISKAKRFHDILFNGVFGRLFVRSKSQRRQFLLTEDDNSFWVSCNMYLLLPIESLDEEINWTAVDSCSSVAAFLKNQSTNSGSQPKDADLNHPNLGYTNSDCKEGSQPKDADLNIKNSGSIYLANDCISSCSLKSKVVVTIHTGRVYSVLDVVVDKCAESPFDVPEYTTFVEYFRKKYGIILKHPRQPIVLLKQSHNPHNLLVDFTAAYTKSQGQVPKKPQNHVHIPPELLIIIDAPIQVLKSLYLLPSVMNRVESLMLASQLRKEIACTSHIPISLILEALTSVRCCESFSLERLELLGDSVLQYAVSCHLFLNHPKMDEGELTSLRSKAVCNSTLHKVAMGRKLQGYIRDSAFDPRRWVAPGQRTVHPAPCSCGVDTLEVPLVGEFQTESIDVGTGKVCDKGHRWVCSKTIADCVEALIGGYYVGGGVYAAIHIMKWFGIEVEIDPLLLDDAIGIASLTDLRSVDMETLETKLKYKFSVEGLLLEALTHPTGVGYCYQRLEFLGDAVLGILVTQYLYQNHSDIDPGLLTDLRSASVCNENFAKVCVKWGFQEHLQHCSSSLASHITKYAESLAHDATYGTVEVPKVLGDLTESIAGAILVDSRLSLVKVWRIFEPLLSPIVSPGELELHPSRKLREWCDESGYSFKKLCAADGVGVQAELHLQLEDVLLVGKGYRNNKKSAKADAARHLLKQLESRGVFDQAKRAPPIPIQPVCSTMDADAPLISPVQMRKGGPREALHGLCKKQLWPLPTFDFKERSVNSAVEFNGGLETKMGVGRFESRIMLHIPNYGSIECNGEGQPNKKSSMDSAALAMICELERLGKVATKPSLSV